MPQLVRDDQLLAGGGFQGRGQLELARHAAFAGPGRGEWDRPLRFLEKFERFAISNLERHAGDVAARLRQTCDDPLPDDGSR